MPDLTAKRTLVKSPPELWEELSEVDGLAKHFSAFGEIKITKLEPERTVAWEGEHGSGTVSIEPSGWGTKVTLHAELLEAAEPEPEATDPATPEPEPERELEPEPEAIAEAEPVDMEPVLVERVSLPEDEPKLKRGFWAWLFRSRTAASAPEPEPLVTEPEPAVAEPEPAVAEPEPVVTEPAPEPAAVEVEEPSICAETEAEPVEADEPLGAEEQASEVCTSLDPERARLVLDEALDALGAAHHRPFSRG